MIALEAIADESTPERVLDDVSRLHGTAEFGRCWAALLHGSRPGMVVDLRKFRNTVAALVKSSHVTNLTSHLLLYVRPRFYKFQ